MQFTTMKSGCPMSEGSQPSASAVKPASTSCRKKNSDNTSFVTELRDHFHEFVHASMDEHKTCLTKTVKRLFAMSKEVAERSADAKEAGAESVLPLQTQVSR